MQTRDQSVSSFVNICFNHGGNLPVFEAMQQQLQWDETFPHKALLKTTCVVKFIAAIAFIIITEYNISIIEQRQTMKWSRSSFIWSV